MSDPRDEARNDEHNQERIEERAELLPEEQAAGSDDPRAQAAAILEESDERTEEPARTRAESTQTPGTDD
ncbi:hypothetical protein [Nocardioides sp.]|uniref:hypothetical protein n=1 Tax=Nocardioides sp. TaxID=35761 RepID=UPI002732605C|nr:hypothetical protein [Nocardioides sp.]MDP3894086.1 hypothetical protein [Nocardioides sp.]